MHQYQGGARKSPARSHPSRSTDATDSADSSTNTPEQHDGRICVPHGLEELDAALFVATRPREAGTDAELLAALMNARPDLFTSRCSPAGRSPAPVATTADAR